MICNIVHNFILPLCSFENFVYLHIIKLICNLHKFRQHHYIHAVSRNSYLDHICICTLKILNRNIHPIHVKCTRDTNLSHTGRTILRSPLFEFRHPKCPHRPSKLCWRCCSSCLQCSTHWISSEPPEVFVHAHTVTWWTICHHPHHTITASASSQSGVINTSKSKSTGHTALQSVGLSVTQIRSTCESNAQMGSLKSTNQLSSLLGAQNV